MAKTNKPMTVKKVPKRKKYTPKGKLGTGSRFKQLTATLAKRGVKNPKALAAYIGRRKYGAKKMAKLAAAGRKKK